MEKNKKIAAAIAAAVAYIKTEEETAAMMQSSCAQGEKTPGFSLWKFSGPLDQMRMRNMMQMRTFK